VYNWLGVCVGVEIIHVYIGINSAGIIWGIGVP